MIYKLMSKKYIQFIFSLICGLSYFGVALNFIAESSNGSLLLAFFFFPAIICGGALIVLKAIKMYIEEENIKRLNFLVGSHVVLFILAVFMTISYFI